MWIILIREWKFLLIISIIHTWALFRYSCVISRSSWLHSKMNDICAIFNKNVLFLKTKSLRNKQFSKNGTTLFLNFQIPCQLFYIEFFVLFRWTYTIISLPYVVHMVLTFFIRRHIKFGACNILLLVKSIPRYITDCSGIIDHVF